MRATWMLLAAALAAAGCGAGGSNVPARVEAPPPTDERVPDAPLADADGDGVPARRDCDDQDPAVWTTTFAHVDADRDGRGAGPLRPVCAGLTVPAGWSNDPTDCDDGDATRWALVRAYADDDLDGAGAGSAQTVCAGATLPTGWSQVDGDCAPADATRWQALTYTHRDTDGDQRWVASAGTVCAGASLPPGYSAAPPPVLGDCDDVDPGAWQSVQAWRDADADGVGEGDPVARCVGERLPAGWAAKGGDCAPGDGTRWQVLAYAGVDADRDGHSVAQAGTLCAGAALPEPYRATASGEDDCDDGDGTRWRRVSAWVDEDDDGVGAGPRLELCVGAQLPAKRVETGGDCAPLDPLAWATLTYAYRDADGDGRTVAASGALCAGAALPAGYSSVASGDDCNDRDPLVWTRVVGYLDADHDGVGAGDAVTFCTSGALPADHVATGSDCAAGDETRWRLLAYAGVDRDRDGYTAKEPGEVCAGATLPDPYRSVLVGNDCADRDEYRYRWVVLYRDADGDGVGAGPRTIECLGPELPVGSSIFGFDADDADSTIQARDDVATELLLDL
jgi:hypothetical protein